MSFSFDKDCHSRSHKNLFLIHRLIQNRDIIGSCSDEHARACHVGCGMVAGWAGTAGLAVWGTLEEERGGRGAPG